MAALSCRVVAEIMLTEAFGILSRDSAFKSVEQGSSESESMSDSESVSCEDSDSYSEFDSDPDSDDESEICPVDP
jgi:hypothetical protein